MRNTGEYEKCCLYYLAKLYEQQLIEGMSYQLTLEYLSHDPVAHADFQMLISKSSPD